MNQGSKLFQTEPVFEFTPSLTGGVDARTARAAIDCPLSLRGPFTMFQRGMEMAKEVKGPEATSTKLAPAKSVRALMSDQVNYDEQKGEIAKEAGDQLKDYTKNKHIDAWAFRTAKALKKTETAALRVKRWEHLRHYVEVLKLDEGAPAVLPGTPGHAEDVTADDLEASGISDDDDDTRDLRPRHLRQPGASGAEIDDAIVKAGGSTVTPLNPSKRGVKDATDAAERAAEKNKLN